MSQSSSSQRKKRKQSVPWSEEEDRRLTELVSENGPTNWKHLSSLMPFPDNERTGKQLRERYTNVLDPKINRACWRVDEEQLIIEFLEVYEQVKVKNMWAELAKLMVNRPANAIKNHWHSTLKRFVVRAKEKAGPRATHYTVELPRSNSNAERDNDTFIRVKVHHPGDPIEEKLRIREDADEDEDEAETPIATPRTPTAALSLLTLTTPQTPTGSGSANGTKERMIRRRKRVTINEPARASSIGGDSGGEELETPPPRPRRTRSTARNTSKQSSQSSSQNSQQRLSLDNESSGESDSTPVGDEDDEEDDLTYAPSRPATILVHAPSPFTPNSQSSPGLQPSPALSNQVTVKNVAQQQSILERLAHEQNAKQRQQDAHQKQQLNDLLLDSYLDSFIHDYSQQMQHQQLQHSPQFQPEQSAHSCVKKRRIELSAPPGRRPSTTNSALEPQLHAPEVSLPSPVPHQHSSPNSVPTSGHSSALDHLLLGWEQAVQQPHRYEEQEPHSPFSQASQQSTHSQRKEALEMILQNDDEDPECWNFGSQSQQHSAHTPHEDPFASGLFGNQRDSNNFFLSDF